MNGRNPNESPDEGQNRYNGRDEAQKRRSKGSLQEYESYDEVDSQRDPREDRGARRGGEPPISYDGEPRTHCKTNAERRNMDDRPEYYAEHSQEHSRDKPRREPRKDMPNYYRVHSRQDERERYRDPNTPRLQSSGTSQPAPGIAPNIAPGHGYQSPYGQAPQIGRQPAIYQGVYAAPNAPIAQPLPFQPFAPRWEASKPTYALSVHITIFLDRGYARILVDPKRECRAQEFTWKTRPRDLGPKLGPFLFTGSDGKRHYFPIPRPGGDGSHPQTPGSMHSHYNWDARRPAQLSRSGMCKPGQCFKLPHKQGIMMKHVNPVNPDLWVESDKCVETVCFPRRDGFPSDHHQDYHPCFCGCGLVVKAGSCINGHCYPHIEEDGVTLDGEVIGPPISNSNGAHPRVQEVDGKDGSYHSHPLPGMPGYK